VSLKTPGETRVDLLFNEQWHNETLAHNDKARHNWQILKRLIHMVVFLGKRELAFRGHDEGKESANKGNYLEILDFLAEYDSKLNWH
jgi:hypothetical protein